MQGERLPASAPAAAAALAAAAPVANVMTQLKHTERDIELEKKIVDRHTSWQSARGFGLSQP